MIKMFVMQTCPYCEYVEKQVEGNPDFEVIDIGKHVRNLKQFLDLRESNPAFDEARKTGDVGIPCYVLEDGTVTLSSKDVGLSQCLMSPKVLHAASTAAGADTSAALHTCMDLVSFNPVLCRYHDLPVKES